MRESSDRIYSPGSETGRVCSTSTTYVFTSKHYYVIATLKFVSLEHFVPYCTVFLSSSKFFHYNILIGKFVSEIPLYYAGQCLLKVCAGADRRPLPSTQSPAWARCPPVNSTRDYPLSWRLLCACALLLRHVSPQPIIAALCVSLTDTLSQLTSLFLASFLNCHTSIMLRDAPYCFALCLGGDERLWTNRETIKPRYFSNAFMTEINAKQIDCVNK